MNGQPKGAVQAASEEEQGLSSEAIPSRQRLSDQPIVPPAQAREFVEIRDDRLLPKNPVVSVAVVTYQHENVLRECVESIASQQTDFPYEIIIAEDASPDRTRQVALDLQEQHPQLIRVVYTAENKGATANGILAVSLCLGELIAVCDGDDFWTDPHKLAGQVAALRARPGVDMAFTRAYRLYSDGRREPGWDYGDRQRVIQTKELLTNFGATVPPSSLMLRAEVLKNLPEFFVTSTFGDFMIAVAGSVRGGAYYDPKLSICYRINHPSSFTVAQDRASRRDKIASFQAAIAHMKRACEHYGVPPEHVRHRLDDYRLWAAKLQLAEEGPIQAMKTLLGVHPGLLVRGTWRWVGRRLDRLLHAFARSGR